MQKVLFFNSSVIDFVNDEKERIHGLSIKALEKEKAMIKLCKVWVDSEAPTYEAMCKKASELVPGQLVDLDYSAVGPRKVILSDIIPGDLAVDFDMIFSRKE